MHLINRVAALLRSRPQSLHGYAMIYRMPAWRNGRRGGLRQNLSARRETGDAELLKVGETFKRRYAVPRAKARFLKELSRQAGRAAAGNLKWQSRTKPPDGGRCRD